MTSLNLLEMSWKDVEAYLKKRTDIILPIGSVEEHGYHLPLSTDGDIALAIAKELSKRTGVIVGPIVWYGVCNTTRAFPGTVISWNCYRRF
jgi:creatinine amidohydrolase